MAGTVAQLVMRLWLASSHRAPAANPDETGYLVAARWMAGFPSGDLSGCTLYQGGYSLLLTPVYWVTRDPAAVYRIVMAINALIGAALFPLGYAAARRLGLGRRAALPVVFAAVLLPASTFFGAWALADAVLPTLALAWLLVLDRFVRNGRVWDAVGASALASYAAMVHSRGAVIVAVHVLVLVAVAVTGRRRVLRAVIGGGAVVIAGYAAGAALNARVRAEMYPSGARDLAANLESRITTVPGQEWALSGAAGQLWYLVVATWGLAGIGLAVTTVVLVRRRTPVPDRIMAGTLLTATLAIAYASSAALPDEHRVGNFAYGRYLSCLALVHTLVGAVALLRSGHRAAMRLAAAALLAVGATAWWVTAYAGERLRTHRFISFDFPETTFLTGDRTALHLPEVTLTGSAALCGFLALSRLGRRYGPVAVAAGLAAINFAALMFAMAPGPRHDRPAPPFPGPEAGGVVADVSLHWALRISLVHPVWWTRVGFIDTRHGGRPAPGVCTVVVPQPDGTPAEATWPAHPAGWWPHAGRRAWSLGWVSWHAPSCDAPR
ncbi:hypothetical protein GCM10022254_23100 [Actinomadura meridiana]|uniref:Integral membrane protein n=1 Tax=Actinomadura meridiana TaxID=559626 RepID=A0ABP8BXX3_9ACTN